MDRDFFISFFEAIPEDRWGTRLYHNIRTQRRCAVGHLLAADLWASNDTAFWSGDTMLMGPHFRGPHIRAAERVFSNDNLHTGLRITLVNDAPSSAFPQDTPKKRVLALFRSLPAPERPIESVGITEAPVAVIPAEELALAP